MEPMTTEPKREGPRQRRPSKEERVLRKALEAEKLAREKFERDTNETLGLLKDLVIKLSEEPEAEKAKQAAGLDEAGIIRLIRAHARGDERRPDYEPLQGPEREALDAVDPLCWIDERTDRVHLVARTGMILLRGRHVLQNGVVIKKLRITRKLVMRWQNCPYYFGGRTPGDMVTNALHNDKWHFFELTERDAREMWMGRDPFPLEVVVRPQDLKEARASGEVFGERMKSSGIALREAVRKILQTHQQVVWFNTDVYCPNWDGRYWRHPYNLSREKFPQRVHPFVNPKEPNPYSTGCPNQTGDSGDVLVPVGPQGEMVNMGPSASVDDYRTLLDARARRD